MSEPALPPVNVKTIARVALALVALASAGILILTFGPLRDRTPDSPIAGAGDPQRSAPAGTVAKTPPGDASGGTAAPGNMASGSKTPGEAVPGGAIPGEAAPGAAASGNTADESSRRAAASSGAAAGVDAPSFDVVRVEPNGEAVIGGRARPNTAIELVMTPAGGATPATEPRVLQRAVTDASGLFAMTNGPLPPGAHVMSLRVRAPHGAWSPSRQSVSVTIQPPGPPLVALLTPDRPTVLISSPDQGRDAAGTARGQGAQDAAAGPDGQNGAAAGAETAARTAQTARISQVETDDDGRLFVVGSARPGATVRLYLNDALLASGVASASGAIEFALQSPLPAGDYRVRLDMVDPATGAVLSRAEAPWENVRAATADGATDEQAKGEQAKGEQTGGGQAKHAQTGARALEKAPRTGKKPSQDAIRAVQVRTHVVARGDTLWSISRRTYQLGSRYTTIYDANQDQITDANRIYPGQVFVLPGKDPAARPDQGGAAPGHGGAPAKGGAPGERH